MLDSFNSATYASIKAALQLEQLYRERALLSWELEKGEIYVPPVRCSSGVRFGRYRKPDSEDWARLEKLESRIEALEKRARGVRRCEA